MHEPIVPPPHHHGMDAESLKQSFLDRLTYSLAVDFASATRREQFKGIAYAVRERLIERWLETQRCHARADAKTVHYLSLEFLIGRLLGNNLLNLDLLGDARQALADLGIDLEELRESEADAGLGGGGLGRLAACFLDSMASLEIPAYGYGIRYQFGIFKQSFVDGAQEERPDNWLLYGNPWEVPRPEIVYPVKFYGALEHREGEDGRLLVEWVAAEEVLAMAYDTPIPGYRNNTVNVLRLWSAKSVRELDLEDFNAGNFTASVHHKTQTEGISKVLYPGDQSEAGRELRLKQQYFFVAATLADILSRYKKRHDSFAALPEHAAIQLNDTHPAIGIPELLRLLIDEEGMVWDEAWGVAVRTFAFTNHTTLPEALEVWPAGLVAALLPRHLDIIGEINRRLLADVEERWPEDEDRKDRMAILFETDDGTPYIRMAHLAIAGSHSVNGVAELHSKQLTETVFNDFHELFPWKFNNKTNGITPRRWLAKANPPLANLITAAIGDGWIKNLDELCRLAPFASDAGFRIAWRDVKRKNKERLASYIRDRHGLGVDPGSLFDVQIKRVHEYKRQLLNLLQLVARWQRLREEPGADIPSRTVLFAGKAAPSYFMAKLIIRLVNAVARVINEDPEISAQLKVLFLPDYRVSLAEKIIPAADLSEQISTAGTEASGTGNMKLGLNGALTLGTLDGANVEILEEVGAENIFIFGATTAEVRALRTAGYDPNEQVRQSPRLAAVLADITGDRFCPSEPGLFEPIVTSLLEGGDQYLLLADFESYLEAQDRVDRTWIDAERWTKMSIANVAGMGKFSADRTIREYNRDIWGATPVRVDLPPRQSSDVPEWSEASREIF